MGSGVHEGTPLTERSVEQSGQQPGVIYIFQEDHEMVCDSEQELVRELTGLDAYRAYGRTTAHIFQRLGGRQIWAGKPQMIDDLRVAGRQLLLEDLLQDVLRRMLAFAEARLGQTTVKDDQLMFASDAEIERLCQRAEQLARVAAIEAKRITFTIEEFGFSRQETLALTDTTTPRTQQ